MVVVHHATLAWSEKFSHQGEWWNGAAGVDLFFVISGFVMAISYANGSQSPMRYLAGRWIRIAPLYWIATVLMLLKMSLVREHSNLGQSAMNAAPSASAIWHSLLFVPYGPHAQPILAQGWTLGFEMFFYLLFAISLYLGISIMRFMFPMLIALTALGALRGDTWPAFTTLLSPLLLEFLGGMLIGTMLNAGVKLPRTLSACLGALGIVCLTALPLANFTYARPIEWGIPAMLVVNAAITLDRTITLPKIFLAIGDASYSLYLSHSFVIAAIILLCRRTPVMTGEWAISAACLIVSVLLSIALYRFCENPMTKALIHSLLTRHDVDVKVGAAIPASSH